MDSVEILWAARLLDTLELPTHGPTTAFSNLYSFANCTLYEQGRLHVGAGG